MEVQSFQKDVSIFNYHIFKSRYAIIDTRDNRIVASSDSWYIVDSLFRNGYDYKYSPYIIKRMN